MTLHRPSRWPHVFIEAGPSIAGVEAGDMLPIELGNYVYLWLHRWAPFAELDSPVSRPALHVNVMERAMNNGPAWRVLDGPPRVERSDTAAQRETWIVEEPTLTGTRGVQGVPASVSKWSVRFVLDGPPLGTVRKFGEHVACRPRLLGAQGPTARSEWLVANHRGRDVLIVEQTFDGTLTWRTEPRRIGVDLRLIRRALPDEPKSLDKEIAAGIVAQMGLTQSEAMVGFDGVVRRIPGERGQSDARAHAFLTLTHGVYDLDDDVVAPANAELQTIQPAPIEQIAAVMRSLFPEQAAREAAIVEECAVLAG